MSGWEPRINKISLSKGDENAHYMLALQVFCEGQGWQLEGTGNDDKYELLIKLDIYYMEGEYKISWS